MAGSLLGVIARDTILRRGPSWASLSFYVGRLLCGVLALAAPALSHITEGGLRHEIVVQEGLSGTTIWVRVPLPVVFGDTIADAARTGAPLAANVLTLEQTGTGARYRVDMATIATSGANFTDRLRRALRVSRNDKLLQPTVTNWRITARRPAGPFNSPDAARAALRMPSTGLNPVFGQAVVEYEMRLPGGAGALSLQTGVTPLVLPLSVDFDTQISRQAIGEPPVTIAQVGQLDQPVSLPPPIWQGILHGIWTVAAASLVALIGLVFMLSIISRPRRAERLFQAACRPIAEERDATRKDLPRK